MKLNSLRCDIALYVYFCKENGKLFRRSISFLNHHRKTKENKMKREN